MTFHHAAGYSATTLEEGILQMRAIQDLHQDVRGWSDIGYQFVIDKAGRLYQGRPFLTPATSLEDLPVLAMGAHAGGANTGNIGISLLGCYHPPEGSWCEDEISLDALETYVTLFAFLSERYGIPATEIYGHRDWGSTSCPGENNYVLIPSIKVSVADLLVTGNEALGTADMQSALDADGVVQVALTLGEDRGIEGYRLERWQDGVRSVLFETSGPLPEMWADDGWTRVGEVEYRLYAIGANNRQQRLATSVVDVSAPGGYLLAETFPNPAASTIGIRYWLPTDGFVDLSIYDALGRRVAQVAEGLQEADQWHRIVLNAADLAAGVYHYRIRVESFGRIAYDQTNEIVVIR
jgi:hypothetical protein